jgi:cephalosporin-C deacetylase-like acetyl esterase
MMSCVPLRPLIRRCVPILFALLAVGVSRGQKPPEPKPGDAMIDAYLAKETDRLSQRVLDGATTLAEWEARRPRLKQQYLDMLGLWPLPEKTPLHATVTGTLEREGVVIEKLHYQSRPGLYVTANLYRPKDVKGRLPAVLYVCGHSNKGRDGNKTAYQDHGLWFATNGYVCLILDTLQLGEVPGIHHGTYRHGRWWWQARGYTPAGVECWNGVRGIDYLVGRPDVDPGRIAVTGISGGGAATFWIAAADERVRCAVPVSGMSDLESYVKNKVINGHCDCMFLINTYGWEWTTIAALVAPRPLLFCNSDQDAIFPMDGNRRVIARLRKLYEMYERPNLVDEYVSHGGHAYRPDLRIAAFRWINRHLKGETGPVRDANFKAIPGPELRAFPEDKDVPADALNGKIDETFVPKAEVNLPHAGKFEEWKRGLLKELREKSFRSFPKRIPEALLTDFDYSVGHGDGALVTEPKISRLDLHTVSHNDNIPLRTLIILNPKEDWGMAAGGWAKPLVGSGVDYYLSPRGVGATEWTVRSPPNYVERALVLLGHTADEGRVRDIIATQELYHPRPKEKWRIIGRGQAGVLAAYAALFEPSITEVVIVDPPTSHRRGPVFLNVLRVLDIPVALGMLAPRRLTLVNATDRAFDRTAEIYRLAGADGKLTRK